MNDIKVLEVLPGNRAIISTRGLRRVVIVPRGEVIAECRPIYCADAMVETFNGCMGPKDKSRAVSVSYPDVLEELVPAKRAKKLAATFNDEHAGKAAVVLPYKSKSGAKAKYRSAL